MKVVHLAEDSVQTCIRGSGTSVFKSDASDQFFAPDMEMLRSYVGVDEDAILARTGAILLGRYNGPVFGLFRPDSLRGRSAAQATGPTRGLVNGEMHGTQRAPARPSSVVTDHSMSVLA